MPKFRKKPIDVEAEQFFVNELPFQDGPSPATFRCSCGSIADCKSCGEYFLEAVGGSMRVTEGDWIIKGVTNDYYPCRPYPFEQTYDAVEQPE